MQKYMYWVVDSVNTWVGTAFSRDEAREIKRFAGFDDHTMKFGDKPPYKIVRYELVNPKVVR